MTIATINKKPVLKMVDQIIADTGLSVPEIAEICGVSKNTIYGLQRKGQSRAKKATASKIASAFGFKTEIDIKTNEIRFVKIKEYNQKPEHSQVKDAWGDDFEVHELPVPPELEDFLQSEPNAVEKLFDLVAMAVKFGIKDSKDLREAVESYMEHEIDKQKPQSSKPNTNKGNIYQVGKGTE